VRNPYFYCIDTEGNQLPYIDRRDETMIADKEVQMLTIMQGGVDYMSQNLHSGGLRDIAPLKAGEKDGKYRVILMDSGSGTGHYYFWNHDCPDDKYRELYRNPKFKAAFHHLRDRERITNTLYYGMGEVTTGFISPKAIEYNYNDEARAWYKKMRDSYVEYDPEKAKQLLDEIGVVDKDGDGWREFPDGSKLELRIDFQATAGKIWVDGHEITIADFAKVGLKIITNSMPVAEFNVMWPSGQGHIRGNWGIGDGPDHLLYPSWVVPDEPNRWSPLGGNYYNARGTAKEDSEKDVSPWQRTPPRWIKSEPDLISEPVLKLQALLDAALSEPDAIKRMELVWQMIQIHIDQGMFGSGTTANTPSVYVYGNSLINAPAREETATGGFNDPAIVPHPAVHFPETFAFV
jgi:peptide/nickel transport system substrate-binding protein